MIEDFSFSLIVGICFVRVVMLPKSSADAIAPSQTLMILLIELTKTTKFHMELEKTVNKWSNPEKKECHLKILQIHKSKDNIDPKQIFRQIRQKKEVRNKFIHALDTQFLPTRIKVAYLKNIVGKTGWTPDEELN